jgi:hypothetical protein
MQITPFSIAVAGGVGAVVVGGAYVVMVVREKLREQIFFLRGQRFQGWTDERRARYVAERCAGLDEESLAHLSANLWHDEQGEPGKLGGRGLGSLWLKVWLARLLLRQNPEEIFELYESHLAEPRKQRELVDAIRRERRDRGEDDAPGSAPGRRERDERDSFGRSEADGGQLPRETTAPAWDGRRVLRAVFMTFILVSVVGGGGWYLVQTLFSPSAPPANIVAGAFLSGTWSGVLTQKDPDANFPVVLELRDAGGRVSYPTLHCEGTVHYETVEENVLLYGEHITSGTCVDNGTIHLYPGGADLGFRWTGPGPGVHGNLTRRAAASPTPAPASASTPHPQPQPTTIAGTWKGTIAQPPGGMNRYPVTIAIPEKPEDGAAITYSNCSGRLQYLERRGEALLFREQITGGDTVMCVSGATVRLALGATTGTAEWTDIPGFPKGVLAQGKLTRRSMSVE